jgi:hypothetical protein
MQHASCCKAIPYSTRSRARQDVPRPSSSTHHPAELFYSSPPFTALNLDRKNIFQVPLCRYNRRLQPPSCVFTLNTTYEQGVGVITRPTTRSVNCPSTGQALQGTPRLTSSLLMWIYQRILRTATALHLPIYSVETYRNLCQSTEVSYVTYRAPRRAMACQHEKFELL